jgi:hypothetical protein
MEAGEEEVGDGAEGNKTVLKDITNDGKEESTRKAAAPRKSSDVGPSTVPPAEGGITTRSRSAKKPAAASGRTTAAAAAVIAKEEEAGTDAPSMTLEEKFDGAVSSAHGKGRRAPEDIDNTDPKRQRRVVTRAVARKIAGASPPGRRGNQQRAPPFPKGARAGRGFFFVVVLFPAFAVEPRSHPLPVRRRKLTPFDVGSPPQVGMTRARPHQRQMST